MKLTLVILFTCFSSYSQVVSDKIITKNLICLQQADDDYIMNQASSVAFSLYMKTDLCSLLEAKSTPSTDNFNANLYIELDKVLHIVPVEDYYNALIPVAIHHNKKEDKIFIVEFQMMSYIKTTGYNYLILDFRKQNKLNYTELDGASPLKNMQAIFNNYIRSKYKVKSIEW